jgi:hypothetical protein
MRVLAGRAVTAPDAAVVERDHAHALGQHRHRGRHQPVADDAEAHHEEDRLARARALPVQLRVAALGVHSGAEEREHLAAHAVAVRLVEVDADGARAMKDAADAEADDSRSRSAQYSAGPATANWSISSSAPASRG